MNAAMPEKQSVYVGRQPIYTANLEVFGYELLYRSGNADNSVGLKLDGDIATTKVIINTFIEIGFDNLVGKGFAFINLTRSFIEGAMPIPFPKERVILEVLEDIPPEPSVIEGLRNLKKQGYKIALDDFLYETKLQPFIDVACVIKIDVRALNQEQLADHVRQLKVGGRMLLAEKIESIEDFEFCKRLGFDYFQGYFLSKPTIVQGQRLPSSKLAVMHILSKLQNPEVEMSELDALVRRDASLSYKLLRYVNSPAMGLGKKISSVQQALLLLGLNMLRRWVMLIIMSGVSDKTDELTRISLIRARMCELLAMELQAQDSEQYFITGLFSALDAMLDMTMVEIMKSLPLPAPVHLALLEREGELGEVLGCALDYECGKWDQIKCKSLGEDKIRDLYLASIAWANEAMESMMV